MVRQVMAAMFLAAAAGAGAQDSRTGLPAAVLLPGPPIEFPAEVDSNSPAFWADGTLHVFNSLSHPYLSEGRNVALLMDPVGVLFRGGVSGPRWMESVIQGQDGTLYGFYHHEPVGVCDGKGRTAPQIGAARSRDTDTVAGEYARFFMGGRSDHFIRFERPSWALGARVSPSAVCVTLLADGSDTHRSTDKRAGGLAGAGGRPVRSLAGPDRSRAIGEGQSGSAHPGLHAPGRDGQGSARPFHAQGLLPSLKAIADTGFLVAFANGRDRHHGWALSLAERVTEPLLTCEAVLAETAFHLRDAALALGMVREGLVTLDFDVRGNMTQLTALAERYADRQPDLADLCLIRMSELHPRHSVITVDGEDFRVYRRNKRETIPVICPPLS